MAAYLITEISGNKDFGGYLSIDGSKGIAIQDGRIYELPAGGHHVEIHSKDDFSRKMSKARYLPTSGSGITDAVLAAGEGDTWTIEVNLDENDILQLSVSSHHSKLVGTPQYAVSELNEAGVAYYEEKFEALRNVFERNKKQLTWGIILALGSVVFGIGAINSGTLSEHPIWTPIVLFGGLLIVGVLMIVFGIKKRVRQRPLYSYSLPFPPND